MKKFEEGDIFVNKIKTHPKVKIFAYNGKIYVNNTDEEVVKLNDFLQETPPPYVAPSPPAPLTFSADIPSISFISSGIPNNVTITATGSGTESFTVSSDNVNFVVSPTSGTITGGNTTVIAITYSGPLTDNSGTITFTGDTNSTNISVSFSTGGGLPGPPGP
jgi:hypothetical protein